MKTRTLLMTALVGLLAAQAAQAYLLEGRIGYPVDRYGTSYGTGSGTIAVKINTLRGVGSSPNYGSWAELSDSERSRLASLVAAAVEYWNKVPDCTIKLAYDGTVRTTSALARRPYFLITTGDLPYGVGGVAYSSKSGSQSFPTGIIVPRSADLVSVTHEIGHQLGLGHSHCGWALTYNSTFGYKNSGGAFMSYARRGTSSMLHEDDMAGIASTYPNSSYGASTGSISGELAGVFGANVFAVDPAGRAVVARLSGMEGYAGAGAHGKFKLPRLAPGTYTLVAASPYDGTYRTGSQRGGYTSFDAYSPTSLAVSIIKGIVVGAGSDTSVGRFSAGTTKTLSGGGSTSPAPAPAPEPTPSAPATVTRTLSWGATSGVTWYYIQVYSHAKGAWVVRKAVAATSVTFETLPGKHTVYLHAYVDGGWTQVAATTLDL